MPVAFWFDHEGQLFCHSWHGHLGRTEVLEFRAFIKTSPPGAPDSLIDLSEVASSEITRDDVATFAQATSGRQRLAIIAPQPVRFGMARMFEAFSGLNGHSTKVAVFRTRREALDWLAKPVGEVSPTDQAALTDRLRDDLNRDRA
jgi:hypothetical protein